MKKLCKNFLILIAILVLTPGGESYSQIFSTTEKKFENALVDAADKGNYDQVVELVKAGNPVDSRGNFDVTALMRAAARGDKKLVDFLISAGANVNSADIGGATALHLASKQGHQNVVDSLIKASALIDIADNEGWTPLMRASTAKKPDVVEALVKAGANVNAANENGETPLMHAAQGGNLKIVKLLMESGAKVTARTESGKTAERFANKFGGKEVEKALIDKRAAPLSMAVKGMPAVKEESVVKKVAEPSEIIKEKEIRPESAFASAALQDTKLPPSPFAEAKPIAVKTEEVQIEEKFEEIKSSAELAKFEEKLADKSSIDKPAEKTKEQKKAKKPRKNIEVAVLNKPLSMQKKNEVKPETVTKTDSAPVEPVFVAETKLEPISEKPILVSENKTLYMVQIGQGFASEKKALEYIEKLKNENAELFTTSSLFVTKAGKSKSSRVRAGVFEARRDAVSLCTSLRFRTIDCTVVETSSIPKEAETIVRADNMWNDPGATSITSGGEKALAKKEEVTPPINQAVSPPIIEPVVSEQPEIAVTAPPQKSPLIDAKEIPLSMRKKKIEIVESNDNKTAWNSDSQEFNAATGQPTPSSESKNKITVGNKIEISKPVEQTEISAEEAKKLQEQTAKVTVAEAIRVPLSQSVPAPYMSKPSSLKRPESKFQPSNNKAARNFTLEFKTFKDQEEATNFFDEISEKSGKQLRIKIITSFDGNVSLRVAGFKTARDALDFCKFRNDKTCNLVNELGSSSVNSVSNSKSRGIMEIVTPQTGKEIFWLQLGSFENEAAALEHFREISLTHGDILNRINPNVSRPEFSSSEKEVFRLRAGPFTNRDEPAKICEKLDKRNINCLTVSN